MDSFYRAIGCFLCTIICSFSKFTGSGGCGPQTISDVFCPYDLKVSDSILFWKRNTAGENKKAGDRADILQEIVQSVWCSDLQMIHSRQVMTALAFMALMNISVLITGNFFSLYITRTLEIRESWIAVFPTIRAVIMLVFMLCMQRWVNRLPFRRVMMTGFLFYLASQLVLIFARAESIGTVLVYTCLEAIGYALVMPRKDSLMSLCIDVRERAKMTALLYVGMIGISVPFGWITGWLSSISGELPFVLNMVLFLTGMIIVRINKTLKDYDRKYYRF